MVRNTMGVCRAKLEAVLLPQQLGKDVSASEGDIIPHQPLLIAAPALWSRAAEPGSSEIVWYSA